MCPLLLRKTVASLDQVADLPLVEKGWLQEKLICWKLAENSVACIGSASLPEEQALCALIKEDVPRLLKELTRWRPELP
jgi:hypothetical protein